MHFDYHLLLRPRSVYYSQPNIIKIFSCTGKQYLYLYLYLYKIYTLISIAIEQPLLAFVSVICNRVVLRPSNHLDVHSCDAWECLETTNLGPAC